MEGRILIAFLVSVLLLSFVSAEIIIVKPPTLGTGNVSWNESHANTLYAVIGSGNVSWNESYANTLYWDIFDGSYNATYATHIADSTDPHGSILEQDHMNARIITMSEATTGEVFFAGVDKEIFTSPSLIWNNTNFRLGIGITSGKQPTSRLEVHGDVNISGILYVTNDSWVYTGNMTSEVIYAEAYSSLSPIKFINTTGGLLMNITEAGFITSTGGMNVTDDVCIIGGNCLSSITGGGNLSWNESFANTLYWNILDGSYNLTYADYAINVSKNYTQIVYDNWNTAWLSTYNATYAANIGNASWNESFANSKYAQYQFTDNNFNGSGNFTTSGWVGIGTPTPTHELNVVGDANITGDIYSNSFQVLSYNRTVSGLDVTMTAVI